LKLWVWILILKILKKIESTPETLGTSYKFSDLIYMDHITHMLPSHPIWGLIMVGLGKIRVTKISEKLKSVK